MTINNIGPWVCPYCGFVDTHTWLQQPSSSFPVADLMDCVNCHKMFAVIFDDDEDADGHVEPLNFPEGEQ